MGMGLFNLKNVQSVVARPVNRIFTETCQPMGIVKRKPDTRTKEQIVQTIDYYAERIPEVKEFAQDIKNLNPKHMGTIADTMELSTHREMLNTSIDMSALGKNGLSYRQAVIQELIEASKTNPEAMELVDAIINNTDTITSKFALLSMSGGILKNKGLAKQMQETAKVIPDIADETLKGWYSMDYSKQHNFMDWIKLLVSPETKPGKIEPLFKDLTAFADKRPEHFEINVNKFIESDAPAEKMAENFKVLPKVIDMLGEKVKNFDIVNFVTKNTNMY